MTNKSTRSKVAEIAATNMLVFRPDAEQTPGKDIAARLLRIADTSRSRDPSCILDTLLLVGEIECALSDCGSPGSDLATGLTDQLAMLFVDPKYPLKENLHLLALKIAETLPETLRIATPEGFAYYALHPGDFCDVFTEEQAASVAVVGIRSIGTTLSAVATATLRARGRNASRITVRPQGHPYNRQTCLSRAQEAWVQDERRRGSLFFVVDEGPGLSGSSFLSAAECLVANGVCPSQICLVGTRNADPTRLCSPDAAARWAKFQWRQVRSRIYERCRGLSSLSGGRWRESFLPPNAEWPPSWVDMETLKFYVPDKSAILKFDGLGESGRRVRERASVLYDSGYGPKVEHVGDGMSRYSFIPGEPFTNVNLSIELIGHIARYCAFRHHQLRVKVPKNHLLEQMVLHNFSEETGRMIEIPEGALQTEYPVVVDGRMQPHKWIRTGDRILKVDGAMHGCDHFLPGPTDIAWDIAGAIVEWHMEGDAQRHFFSACQKQFRCDTDKLLWFVLAYATFRTGYCKMAWNATEDPAEKARFCKAYSYYRDKMLKAATRASSAS